MVATSPIAAQGSAIPEPPVAQAAPTRKHVVVRADGKSGKLVTRVISVRSGAAPAPSMNISKIVDDAARENNVDPLLVHSVIRAESAYNPFAVSSAGAQGLMQLMPATARTLGVHDSFDPKQNIEAGVRYLKYLKDLYHDDDRLALAAYNAGPKAVEKYHGDVPPYPETQQYVRKVGDYYVEAQKAAGIYKPAPTMGAVELQTPDEDTHPKLEQFVDEYGRLHLRSAPR